MRVGLMSFLLVAIPSVSFAQVVVPCRSLDVTTKALLPVATVTRLGDAIALADAQPRDTFVLGAATLEMKDPACTKIAFTMTNATDAPIALTNVSLHSVRVNAGAADGRLYTACSTDIPTVDRRFSKDATLQPGATVSVEMPIARDCPSLGPTVGFLVSIRSDGSHWWLGDTPVEFQTAEAARLRKAFETLVASKQ